MSATYLDLDLGFSPDLIILATLSNGAYVLHRKPATSAPGDNYLEVVLAYRPGAGSFITWMVNHQTGGAGHGHYYVHAKYPCIRDRYKSALYNYDARGVPTLLAQIYTSIVTLAEDWDAEQEAIR